MARYCSTLPLILLFMSLPLLAQPAYLGELDRIEARQQWLIDQRVYPGDSLPIEHIRKVSEREVARRRKMKADGIQSYRWQAVGPDSTGGRMPCIAVHPVDKGRWYAGSAGGGVWRTLDYGNNWQQLDTRAFPVFAVGAIAIDPYNPDQILAGTGEANFSYNNYPGFGMLRSRDGGETWQRVGTSSLNGSITDLEYHPHRTGLVFAACAGFGGTPGIYRSTDGGNFWSLVLFGPTGMDVAIHPDGRVMIASLSHPTGHPDNGLYRSLDTGKTWNKLDQQFTPDVGRTKLAFAQSSPARLYVLAANPTGGLAGLYRSDNNGNSFRKMPGTPPRLFGDSLYGQGWYDIAIAIAPDNSDDVIIGGIELHRSTDGGESFRKVSGLHVDQHAIKFLGPDSIAVANDGGVYLVEGFKGVARINKLSTTQFYDIAVSGSDRIMGGTQDRGSHILQNGAWRPLLGGDIMKVLFHRANPDMLLASGQNGIVYRSINNGDNWSASINGIDYSEASAWVAPLAHSAIAGATSTFYCATARVYKSTNNGAVWEAISPALESSVTPITAFGQSPQDEKRLLAATNNGKVHFTWSGGIQWQPTADNLPNRRPTSVSFHPEDKRVFFVTFSGYSVDHVWRSTNEGASWASVSGNLPDIPVNCFAFDPERPGTKWYVGTDLGVYYTQDAGRSWHPLLNGLGIAAVTDIEFDPDTRLMYIGTYGRGIFRESIDFLPVQLSKFGAQWHGREVLVYWSTASEQNNAHFVIERSVAGADFEDVGLVPGRGTTTLPQNYEFRDAAAPRGTSLRYRLRQVDFDNSFSLSDVFTLESGRQHGKDSSGVHAYPNPGSQKFTLEYHIARTSRVSIALYDGNGARVRDFLDNGHHNAGRFYLEWNGRNNRGAPVPDGQYYFHVSIGEQQHLIPVIKQ